MPITVGCKSLGALCTDYEFQVEEKEKLAELVAKLCLGQCSHVSNVIKELEPDYPNADEYTINSTIQYLDLTGKDSKYIYKVHGWLFQMMSWLALSIQHKDDRFLQHYPHSQPAMQGIDGIAITLNEDGGVDSIIVTEDKCTDNPRNTITTQVWDEFDKMESGIKNAAIYQQLQTLFRNDEDFHRIQNDVYNRNYRQYRIGITRDNSHNSDAGRLSLYEGYESHVTGDNVARRTGASTNIDGLRAWMEDLRLKVIEVLKNEL